MGRKIGLRLLMRQRLHRRVPGSGADLPVPDWSEFSKQKRTSESGPAERVRHERCSSVSIDSENIHALTKTFEGSQFRLAGTGDHSANRMIGILFLNEAGEMIEFFPDQRIPGRRFESFGLVPESPQQQRRMMFQPPDHFENLIALALAPLSVPIIEAVALMSDGKTGHNNEPMRMSLIKFSCGIRMPGAESGGTEFSQQVKTVDASGSFHKKRSTVTQ